MLRFKISICHAENFTIPDTFIVFIIANANYLLKIRIVLAIDYYGCENTAMLVAVRKMIEN